MEFLPVCNGAAGAFINNDLWKSFEGGGFMSYGTNHKSYIVLYGDKDSLSLIFRGESNVFQSIKFNLSNLHIHEFQDLALLNNRKIELDGTRNSAVCMSSECFIYYPDESCSHTTGGTGQLWIRNVYLESSHEAVLSGTFGFEVNDPSKVK